MAQYRSEAPMALAAKVRAEHDTARWSGAARWLNRVGLARLAADAATWEALYLLRSIHRATYRSEPELDALLIEAREVAERLAVASNRSSWAKFNRGR